MRICNQYLVPDEYRDMKKTMTIRCIACSEESSLQHPFPIEVKRFTNYLDAFIKLHKVMGCNDKQLPPPDWK